MWTRNRELFDSLMTHGKAILSLDLAKVDSSAGV